MGGVEGKGLLVDYGGVLTTSAGAAFRAFEREVGLTEGTVLDIIVRAYEEPGDDDPIARFERGESTADEFAEAFVERLAARGQEVEVGDVHTRVLSGTRREPRMWELVRRAREAGVRTALVSNSWGVDGYPLEELRAHFDTLVISGEVGLRKPDRRIYELAADRLELPPRDCAFIDDLPQNVAAARSLGMFAVHHTDVERTADELTEFLELELRDLQAPSDDVPGYAHHTD